MTNELNQIEEKIDKEFHKYKGLLFEDLAEVKGLNATLINGKLSTVTLVNRMLKDAETNMGLLEKQGTKLVVKSVRLKENGMPKESMSFEQINFNEVVREKWENSFIRNKFLNTVFCFFVFQEKEEQSYFKGIKLWKMPSSQLESEVQKFWNHLKKVLTSGVIIQKKKRGLKFVSTNNLPSSKDNPIMHVRPKAKDSNDVVELPCGNFIVKQAYWLNGTFVGDILKKMVNPDLKFIQKYKKNANILNWKNKLQNDIYTINDVVKMGQSLQEGFTELDIDVESFAELGYRIESSFLVREKVRSLDQYLYQRIMSNNYFDSNSEKIFEMPFVKRKIDNLENAYKLLKVEKSLYLTEMGMENAKVNVNELTSYKYEVENFVQQEKFFTIESIKSEGFVHEIDEYGFDNIFYESLLKRPGRLKHITFGSRLFFIKTIDKVNQNTFIRQLMVSDYKSIEELISDIEAVFKMKLSYDAVENSLNNLKELYYVPNMRKLFISKAAYLDYIE